jgi:hypothetical protein
MIGGFKISKEANIRTKIVQTKIKPAKIAQLKKLGAKIVF